MQKQTVNHISPVNLQILLSSAQASVDFAVSCLEPSGTGYRARSSFVDPTGHSMHWHDFGDLVGPGWAANAIGGAILLQRWGHYWENHQLQEKAAGLVRHVLEAGYLQDDGFIWPYYDLAKGAFCLNYTHNNDWVCPGSLAKVGVQLLEYAACPGVPVELARCGSQAAHGLANWLADHTPRLPNGWIPRRITPAGQPYPLNPHGQPDTIFDHSADGLYLLQLWALSGHTDRAQALGAAFVQAGGWWGSINHDTFDDHENVAYAAAFRILTQLAGLLGQPGWRAFAYERVFPAIAGYHMDRDEHGVRTRGLYWMEASWDTAYLWENAEVAQAYLEAWLDTKEARWQKQAVDTLLAIATHHYGALGFLSEGIDWNNHVSQRHHINYAYYGAIRYTEPLLNNLHLVLPTLTLLEASQAPHRLPPSAVQATLDAHQSQQQPAHAQPARYLLRLYHSALASDESVAAVLEFCRQAGVSAVLLFEASYDLDPALLTPAVLAERFARLKEIAPRFQQADLEVHINTMITLGHVDAGGAQPERLPFQFMISENGAISRSTACPLDATFLEYARQLYRQAAETGASVVWVDDDVRFLYHDTTGMSCFCPLHLAEMERRTGRPWTRQELVEGLSHNQDQALRQAWFDLQEAAIANLAREIEKTVHAVNPQCAIGLMTVGTAIHAAEGRHTDRLLRILSGTNRQPWIRPGSGHWNDAEPAAVLAKTNDVARQVSYIGRDDRVVAEIENHPYSPFLKAWRSLALELTLNVLAGAPELSLNIFSGAQSFDHPAEQAWKAEFAGRLARLMPYLKALALARAGKTRLGIGVEASEDVARRMPWRQQDLLNWVEGRPWEMLLGRLGLPVGQPQAAPHWLSGACAAVIDPMAIDNLLQEGLILTPAAAHILLERGYGHRLGIAGVTPVHDLGVNEHYTHAALNGAWPKAVLPVRHSAPQLNPFAFQLAPAGQAQILSEWIDVNGNRQGAAAAVLELAGGERLGLVPFEPAALALGLLQPAHADQWAAMCEWVTRSRLPVRVTHSYNLVPQLFQDTQSEAYLLALVNLSGDEQVVQLTGSALPGSPTSETLRENGRWQSLARLEAIPISAWSLVVVRWGKA